MKFKGDFVTNSSSTAFFFIFKGRKLEKMYDLIDKYSRKFEMHVDYGYGNQHDYHHCDSNFVKDSIATYIDSKANPGRITKRIHVDLPYPRTLDVRKNKRFFELEGEVEESIRVVGDKAQKKSCS